MNFSKVWTADSVWYSFVITCHSPHSSYSHRLPSFCFLGRETLPRNVTWNKWGLNSLTHLCDAHSFLIVDIVVVVVTYLLTVWCCCCQGVCTEAGMYALRERRVHVTQEDFELAVAKVLPFACICVWRLVWRSGNGIGHIGVEVRWVQLVLGLVTFGRTLYNPGIFPGTHLGSFSFSWWSGYTGDGLGQGRNGEFCVVVGPVTSTAGMLV